MFNIGNKIVKVLWIDPSTCDGWVKQYSKNDTIHPANISSVGYLIAGFKDKNYIVIGSSIAEDDDVMNTLSIPCGVIEKIYVLTKSGWRQTHVNKL